MVKYYITFLASHMCHNHIPMSIHTSEEEALANYIQVDENEGDMHIKCYEVDEKGVIISESLIEIPPSNDDDDEDDENGKDDEDDEDD